MKRLPASFGRKGFTLIELLIVIVIIGILAGVVLVVLNPAKQQRKSAESVLAANTNKVCLALNSCAATTAIAANCSTLALIGAADPGLNGGVPTGATYAPSSAGNVVTVTGSLIASGGSKGGAGGPACNYTCSFDFANGTGVALAPTAGCY